MNNREQVIERMERFQGWSMIGVGMTISASGVLRVVSSVFLESARRINASFYSAAAKVEVDPGLDPTTIALGAGGLAMMGGGVYILNQGVAILDHFHSKNQ